MDWYHWKAEICMMVIWGFGMLSFLSYAIWITEVRSRNFAKRWHFFVGMIPCGTLVILFKDHIVPDIIEYFSEVHDGIKYYFRR